MCTIIFNVSEQTSGDNRTSIYININSSKLQVSSALLKFAT